MPFGHIHGSPGVVVTWSKPSRLYAADGVTLKTLNQMALADNHTYQTIAANGDRMQVFLYARGNETILDLTTYRSTNRAIWDLYVNDVLDSAGYDDYGAAAATFRHIVLTQPIKSGYNVLEFRANGKNAASTDYYIAIIACSIQ